MFAHVKDTDFGKKIMNISDDLLRRVNDHVFMWEQAKDKEAKDLYFNLVEADNDPQKTFFGPVFKDEDKESLSVSDGMYLMFMYERMRRRFTEIVPDAMNPKCGGMHDIMKRIADDLRSKMDDD